MAVDKFSKRCQLMSDEELVAALCIERDQYTPEFHLNAGAELSRRGIRLSEFKNHVGIKTTCGIEETGTIEQAMRALERLSGPFDILACTNCLGHTLTLQAGNGFWMGHYAARGAYRFSFTIRPSQKPADVLKAFLELEDWSGKIEETFGISEWEILLESDSSDHIMAVSQILTQKNIPSLMTDTTPYCLSSTEEGSCRRQPFIITVPQQHLDAAQKVLREIKLEIDGLYREIEERARQGDRQAAELSALTRLIRLVPDDARAHYRRGVLLAQMGKDEEAADALIASLINNSGHEELFHDAYEELERLSARHPENVHILHNLATFCVTRDRDPRSVEKYYRRILAVRPEDAMAHLQLGYIYYESDDDISAYRHLKRYLELEPQADDRVAIECILGELRALTPPGNEQEKASDQEKSTDH